MATQMHYWVGNRSGYVMSTTKECPLKQPSDRLKYMGHTECMGWPKKMSTGRVLHKPIGRKLRKYKKLRKQDKTDTTTTK